MSSNELEASLRLDGELDARFLMLCTPQLEQAHRALQARSHHCLRLSCTGLYVSLASDALLQRTWSLLELAGAQKT